ncbi:C-type lectin domain family 18 member A-like isoform X2 [Liolophura sinensis]|uniref:C-type lectin domain family 18 member A-like isoform X2 n=1 Tax=Liolophura sinensis TaxID=3198878 RepID=UPI003158691B
MELQLKASSFLLTVSILSIASALRPTVELQILDQHNRLRREYASGRHGVSVANMKKLKWSSTLANRAGRLARCRNVNRLLQLDRANLNVALSTTANTSEMVNYWFSGIADFSPEFGACVQKGICRFFSTMMSGANYRIGCAESSPCWTGTSNQKLFVCLYSGRSLEHPIFRTGSPCSKCTGEASFCEAGLCVPCSMSEELCDCRKTCGLVGVGSGYLDERTCTCACAYGMGPNCDEPCENPDQYVDWDVCADVTPADCRDPDEDVRKLYAEFCPAKCTCRKHPGSL